MIHWWKGPLNPLAARIDCHNVSSWKYAAWLCVTPYDWCCLTRLWMRCNCLPQRRSSIDPCSEIGWWSPCLGLGIIGIAAGWLTKCLPLALPRWPRRIFIGHPSTSTAACAKVSSAMDVQFWNSVLISWSFIAWLILGCCATHWCCAYTSAVLLSIKYLSKLLGNFHWTKFWVATSMINFACNTGWTLNKCCFTVRHSMSAAASWRLHKTNECLALALLVVSSGWWFLMDDNCAASTHPAAWSVGQHVMSVKSQLKSPAMQAGPW